MRDMCWKRGLTLLFGLVLVCGTVLIAGCEFQVDDDDDVFDKASANVPAQQALPAESPATANVEQNTSL